MKRGADGQTLSAEPDSPMALKDARLPLEKAHPHGRDLCITFEPEKHKYTVTRDGVAEEAPVSVTSFAKRYFKSFDATAVIDKNYDKWKSDTGSKYYSLIHATLSTGASEDQAKFAIANLWSSKAEKASHEGTSMHSDAEFLLNGLEVADSKEMQLLRKWRKEFQPHMKWVPERTEWKLWWEDARCDGAVLVAGTLDLLMRSETTDEYALVDFKRTNPAPKYTGGPPNLLGPHQGAKFHPGYADAPLGELENNDFGKYTMQLNILAIMLQEKYGIVVKNTFLLQMHPGLDEAHCVQVPGHMNATDSLFTIEAERLRQSL
jgi:hypothetical protein